MARVASDESTEVSGFPHTFRREATRYALWIRFDADSLPVRLDDSLDGPLSEVRRILGRHGFQWQQGRMYFGTSSVTAATVMIATIELTTQLPWFAASVRDIRMLRIEEMNDLMAVVQRVAGIV